MGWGLGAESGLGIGGLGLRAGGSEWVGGLVLVMLEAGGWGSGLGGGGWGLGAGE